MTKLCRFQEANCVMEVDKPYCVFREFCAEISRLQARLDDAAKNQAELLLLEAALQARVKELESGYKELSGWGDQQCTMRHVSTFAKKFLPQEPPE